jgi:hypothetical protein
MKRINLFLLATTVLFAAGLHAQTVDEIINKHIEAIGGKEKLGQVKSVYSEISMEVMGNESPVTEYTLEGKGFKSEAEVNGSKIISCFTDKGGWGINQLAGISEAQAMPDELYKAGRSQIYVGGALLDYASKGNAVELVGKEQTNYKIKVTNGSTESTYFIDSATHYLVKTVSKGEMMGSPVEVVTSFSDHKKTDFGIVLPHARIINLGDFALSAKVNKVEVNREIDPKIFEQPK